MINILCKAKDSIKLLDISPFQGNLKKRDGTDISELTKSLVSDGLVMPFVIWRHDNKNSLLDGHGRLEALLLLSVEQPDILKQEFPCLFVQAQTEAEARKALLQISSQYGKMTKKGVLEFTASIPEYVTPSIQKYVAPVQKVPTIKKDLAHKIIRIRIPADKYDAVKSTLSQISYIEVL